MNGFSYEVVQHLNDFCNWNYTSKADGLRINYLTKIEYTLYSDKEFNFTEDTQKS